MKYLSLFYKTRSSVVKKGKKKHSYLIQKGRKHFANCIFSPSILLFIGGLMSWPCARSDTLPEDMFNKQITQYLATRASPPQNPLPEGSLSCRAQTRIMSLDYVRSWGWKWPSCCHLNNSSVLFGPKPIWCFNLYIKPRKITHYCLLHCISCCVSPFYALHEL